MGNQNSGRRPAPTTLTVMRGNPGRRRLNDREPMPPADPVEKVPGLSAGASAIWDELAPICRAMGTLTAADVRAFRTLCELQSTIDVAFLHKDGRELVRLVPEDERVTIVIDAILKLERDTANILRPYYEYFGLTPSSRARIMVTKPKDEAPASTWAGLLK